MREFPPEQAADAGDITTHQRSGTDRVDDVEGDCAADVD